MYYTYRSSVHWTAFKSAILPATSADVSCSDFDTQQEAQELFETHIMSGNTYQLDGNGDGQVCESLPGAVHVCL